MSIYIDEMPPEPEKRELIPRPEDRTNGRRWALWFGVVGGIASWAAHLGIAWGLVPYSCDHGNEIWLHVNTIVFAIVTIIGFFVSLSTFRDVRDERRTDTTRSAKAMQTDHFMSLIGMIASAYFFILIVSEGASVLVLEPCGIAT